jgi:hypothetical protein
MRWRQLTVLFNKRLLSLGKQSDFH